MIDDEDDEEDPIEELQEEIKKEGTKGDDETFAVMPAKGAVIFVINSLPGREGKALAMQLPPTLAVQLGNALINAAIMTSKVGGEENVEEVQSAYTNDEPKKKEWVN